MNKEFNYTCTQVAVSRTTNLNSASDGTARLTDLFLGYSWRSWQSGIAYEGCDCLRTSEGKLTNKILSIPPGNLESEHDHKNVQAFSKLLQNYAFNYLVQCWLLVLCGSVSRYVRRTWRLNIWKQSHLSDSLQRSVRISTVTKLLISLVHGWFPLGKSRIRKFHRKFPTSKNIANESNEVMTAVKIPKEQHFQKAAQ